MIENKPSQQDDKDKQTQPIGMGGAQGGSAGRVASFSSGQQTPGSGRFTNLQKYIGANQGAGQQLQQRIGSNVEKGVEKTEKQATSQASQIADQVNKANTSLGKADTFKQQIQQDPTQLTQNQANADEVKKLMANQNIGSTVGSQAQQAQDQLNAQANAQAQNIQQLGSEQGRFNLLKNTIKTPNYSTGQQKLDQLFMQAQGGRALDQQQQQLQQNLQALQSRAGSQLSDLAAQGKSIGQKEAQVADELRQTISGEETKLSENLDKAASELNTSRAQLNTDLDAFMSGVATPEQKARIQPILQQSGLSAGTQTYGVLKDKGRENYLQKGDVNLTGANVIDQAALNRYQALANLAGVTDPNMLKYSQVGNKGKDTGLLGEKLKTDIEQAKSKFLQDALSNEVKAGSSRKWYEGATRDGENGLIHDPGYWRKSYASGNMADFLAGKAPTYTGEFGDQNLMDQATQQEALKQYTDLMNQKLKNSAYSELLGGGDIGLVDPYAKVKLF